MKSFFSVGEPSGDQHAAHLIHELRRRHPEIECCGFGGPLMSGAGCRIDFRLTDLAVMGLLRIVPMIMKFVRVLRIAVHVFERDRPDAVVLVDFPGFNWWVARKAKKAGIPVIYYLPPQLWAWAPWRIRRMKRLIDHVLCALPFEPKWYSKRGLDVEFVSHPFFDEVADYKLDQETLAALRQTEGRLVAVLPGSRDHEVDRNWPSMQQVLQRVHEQHPDVVFVVACYRDEFRERCQQMLDEAGLKLPIRIGMNWGESISCRPPII